MDTTWPSRVFGNRWARQSHTEQKERGRGILVEVHTPGFSWERVLGEEYTDKVAEAESSALHVLSSSWTEQLTDCQTRSSSIMTRILGSTHSFLNNALELCNNSICHYADTT